MPEEVIVRLWCRKAGLGSPRFPSACPAHPVLTQSQPAREAHWKEGPKRFPREVYQAQREEDLSPFARLVLEC